MNLDFTKFKSVGGVTFPANADVPTPTFHKRGSVLDDPKAEIAICERVETEAKVSGHTGKAGRQWRQNRRRNLRAQARTEGKQ